MLARSKAGHDKDEVFVVTGESTDRVALADGKGRTLERPKMKNRLHVQLIRHLPEETLTQLEGIRKDEDVRRILKAYSDRNRAGQ